MPKLIKAESYKLFHSVYLWLIGLGFLLLNSSIIPDYLKRGFTWFDGSLYIGKFFFFMIAASWEASSNRESFSITLRQATAGAASSWRRVSYSS